MKRLMILAAVALACSVNVTLKSSPDRSFWALEQPTPVEDALLPPLVHEAAPRRGIRLEAGHVLVLSLDGPVGAAWAGETFLGSIVSAAGADTTNATTAVPFVIAQAGTRLTIQCTATAYIAVDDLTAVTASRGVTVAADALFLTKVDMPTRAGIPQKIIIGTTTSAVVRIAGPAAVTCDVWSRRGDE